jgi:hypothetical protein
MGCGAQNADKGRCVRIPNMANEGHKEIQELESELLRLDAATRAALARTLLASLDTLPDEEYERLWVEEAEARYADFLAGRTGAVDGDDVFARAHARVRSR